MTDLSVHLPLLGSLMFSMIGPIGLLPLFASVTSSSDRALQKKIAFSAAAFSLFAFSIAIFLGSSVMQSAGTSQSSLTIAGGIILTLTALRTIFGSTGSSHTIDHQPSIRLAIKPISIPGIVTPVGVAIVILFASYFTDLKERLAILGIVAIIMILNALAMISAHWFMKTIGASPLIILGAIFGVLQAAMGIEMIVSGISLSQLIVAR